MSGGEGGWLLEGTGRRRGLLSMSHAQAKYSAHVAVDARDQPAARARAAATRLRGLQAHRLLHLQRVRRRGQSAWALGCAMRHVSVELPLCTSSPRSSPLLLPFLHLPCRRLSCDTRRSAEASPTPARQQQAAAVAVGSADRLNNLVALY